MNRRKFMAASTAASLLYTVPITSWGQTDSADGIGSLSLNAGSAAIPIPANFTGLSYEAAQLANPGYFSASNTRLVRLVRQLGDRGVLRIGGNTSDFDIWKPEHVARTASWAQPVGPDSGLNIGTRTVVSQSSLDQLHTFLKATGWSLIYGIDLGHGDPNRAADEAAYVVKTIGPSLLALQIGNEADLFFRNGMRKPDYGYADFFAEWQKFADAIRERTPSAPIAGPDIGNHIPWVDQFAHQAKGINMLTSHYYAGGPPTSPSADIPHLMRKRPVLEQHLQHLVTLSRSVDLPYRMSEGNTIYHAGKAGVSDAFASALWGADFMMLLTQMGVAGVNFHGGGQGHYTPIAGGGTMPFQARPLYYGMLLYKEFAKGSLLPLTLATQGLNSTAYASSVRPDQLTLAVINKEATRELRLNLNGPRFGRPLREMALRGPNLASLTGVTLGGQPVPPDGIWHGGYTSATSLRRSVLVVPPASALLIEFGGKDA